MDETRKMFEVCNKAGIATDFDSLFGKDFLDDFEKNIATLKENALKPRFGVTFDESMWDEPYQIRKELIWHVIDFAIENKKGFSVDWRFSAEDVVFNLQMVMPDTKIQTFREIQKNGIWVEPVEIDGKTIDFKMDDEELICDRVVREINSYLEKTFNCIFMTTDLGGDIHYYLRIPTNSESDFENLGFFRP